MTLSDLWGTLRRVRIEAVKTVPEDRLKKMFLPELTYDIMKTFSVPKIPPAEILGPAGLVRIPAVWQRLTKDYPARIRGSVPCGVVRPSLKNLKVPELKGYSDFPEREREFRGFVAPFLKNLKVYVIDVGEFGVGKGDEVSVEVFNRCVDVETAKAVGWFKAERVLVSTILDIDEAVGTITGLGNRTQEKIKKKIVRFVTPVLRRGDEISLADIATNLGIGANFTGSVVQELVRGGRLANAYLRGGVLVSSAPSKKKIKQPPPRPKPVAGAAKFCTSCGAAIEPTDKFCTRCGAKLEVMPEVRRAPTKLKPAQIEQMVYGYVVDHGGEIDVAECAEELGLSAVDVKRAVKSLVRKGKVAME